MWERIKRFWAADRSEAVARPQSLWSRDMDNPWAAESILILGDDPRVRGTAQILSRNGAHVEFKTMVTLQCLYQIPLEHFSVVIMTDTNVAETFDVMDIGGIIRRTDPSIRLVWASTTLPAPQIVDKILRPFCDATLNTHCSEADLIFALK
jgi:hypothetical protein